MIGFRRKELITENEGNVYFEKKVSLEIDII